MEPLADGFTKEEFENSGWKDVIDGCAEKECHIYSSAFGAKAQEMDKTGNTTASQTLRLLGAATSLHLKLDTPAEPFVPMLVLEDLRTVIVDDFDDTHLQFLREIVTHISDAELQARIADILWLRTKDFRSAQLASSAYLRSAEILEDPEHWVPAVDRMERATQLAVILGRNGEYFKSAIAHLENVLAKYGENDTSFLSAKIMKILLEYRVGDSVMYATLADKLANRSTVDRNWHRAREYWQIKAKWLFASRAEEAARNAKIQEAETYVQEAEDALKRDPPSYTHAAAFVQFAIEAYRRIGNTKERVDELHAILLEYQQKSIQELGQISSSVDITELVRLSEEQVKGKTLPEALISIATLGALPKIDHLKAQAREIKDKYVFQSLLPKVFINALGRVVARQPTDAEEAMLADMFNLAATSRGLHIQALVEPARQQINAEHYVRINDFISFLSNSPLVPEGRELIIARGLYAGFIGDFLTAVHFLVPQLEATMRYLLSQSQVITSGVDDDGIQDEYNINRLLSSSTFTEPLGQILGKDMVFDLRGLLVERFGSNLRNDMAHGLMHHDMFYSAPAYYLWWIALRLYLLPTIRAIQQAQQKEQSPES